MTQNIIGIPNETISKVTKPLLFTADVAPYNLNSGSTITADDWVNKRIITVNPTGNQTITSPSASDILAALQTQYGSNVITVTSTFQLIYFNQSAFTSTITGGTGVTFSRGGPSTIVAATTTAIFWCFMNTTGPAFICFGN